MKINYKYKDKGVLQMTDKITKDKTFIPPPEDYKVYYENIFKKASSDLMPEQDFKCKYNIWYY